MTTLVCIYITIMFTCVCVIDVGQISVFVCVLCVFACIHVAEVANGTDGLLSHQEGSPAID